MKKVLTLSEYTLRYNKRLVLSNISFDTYEREVHAICGMADSGVEYIRNALLRIHPMSFREIGDITLNGTLLTKLPDEQMQYIRLLDIGQINADTVDPTFGMLTVKQLLLSPYSEPLKKTKKEIYVDAIRILDLMGVKRAAKVFRKKLSSLSKKELRAVMTACAICSDPSVVILSAFGKTETDDDFYNLIIKICKIKNIALLILTSDIILATKYAEKITILERGQVAETFAGGSVPQSFHAKFLQNPSEFYEKMQFCGDEVITKVSNCFISKHSLPLSFNLYRGEIVGIHTRFTDRLLRILSGKTAPKAGEVIRGSENLSKIKPYNRGIFVINHLPHKMFLPQTKISELFARFGSKISKADLSAVFSMLDLEDKITASQIDMIDAFTCARLCLALAVYSGADTVILPNPHLFCSPAEQYTLMQYIKKLCMSGLSFILISDKTDFIKHVSDNYIELD